MVLIIDKLDTAKKAKLPTECDHTKARHAFAAKKQCDDFEWLVDDSNLVVPNNTLTSCINPLRMRKSYQCAITDGMYSNALVVTDTRKEQG